MNRLNLLDNGTATLSAFARKPALLGCAARMLNGAHCVSPLPVGDRDVELAEEWVASVCLFHRVLGLPRPKRAQALNTRANAGAAAAAKFADDLERHGADGACVAAARERGRNALR